MASALVMMIGGAISNALAFTGSNYMFSKIGKSDDAEKERERHDQAMEKLSRDKTKWDEEILKRLDFLNERIQEQDQAMKEYYNVTGDDLPPEHKLSDYYTPSDDQKNRELLFVVGGMTLTGYVAWKLH